MRKSRLPSSNTGFSGIGCRLQLSGQSGKSGDQYETQNFLNGHGFGFGGGRHGHRLGCHLEQAAGDTVFYGPPVMPTLLLGAAAQQGRLKERMPFAVKVWKDVDMLRAGLAKRSIPLSIVPSYVAANLAARGQDVKLLNIMTFGLLHIIGSEPLPGLAALAGKKLVMPFKNDMPDLVLQLLCRKQGIALGSFQTLYTATPPEALMMFMRGHADYAPFCPSPWSAW